MKSKTYHARIKGEKSHWQLKHSHLPIERKYVRTKMTKKPLRSFFFQQYFRIPSQNTKIKKTLSLLLHPLAIDKKEKAALSGQLVHRMLVNVFFAKKLHEQQRRYKTGPKKRDKLRIKSTHPHSA